MTENHNKNPTSTPVKVTLTGPAAEKIRAMMRKEGKEGHGLRLGVTTGGCAGFSYDMRFQKSAYENDHVIEQSGITIFVNKESVPFLNGLHVDYLDSLKESGFKFKNPNAQSSCGCGTSFS